MYETTIALLLLQRRPAENNQMTTYQFTLRQEWCAMDGGRPTLKRRGVLRWVGSARDIESSAAANQQQDERHVRMVVFHFQRFPISRTAPSTYSQYSQ